MVYLLENSILFNKRCFMTATPIKKEYWFKELKGLSELSIEYDLPSVPLKHFKCINVISEAAAIVLLNKDIDKNVHFFLNSVKSIANIIEVSELKTEDVRIVCANNKKNKENLKGFQINNTKDKVKKVNFYTSTCFEGADIFDKDGQIYVLCDGKKAYTLLDVSVTLPQIAGRIRDIEDNTVNLLYTSTRYINITEEEFTSKISENIRVGRVIVSEAISKETIEALDDEVINSNYIIKQGDKLIFEETLLNVDKSNFEISKTFNCKANIVAKANPLFMPVTVQKPWEGEIKEFENDRIKKLSFKDKCKLYYDLKSETYSFIPDFEKDVIDAINILGIERCTQLNFHKKDIKTALLSKTSLTEDMKILKSIHLLKGEFYTSAYLKLMFTEIYNSLSLTKTAKGSDIEKYFHVEQLSKKIDGTTKKGYRIITPKINFK